MTSAVSTRSDTTRKPPRVRARSSRKASASESSTKRTRKFRLSAGVPTDDFGAAFIASSRRGLVPRNLPPFLQDLNTASHPEEMGFNPYSTLETATARDRSFEENRSKTFQNYCTPFGGVRSCPIARRNRARATS